MPSRMGSDGKYRNNALARAIMPEYSVGSGGVIFNIGLKGFFPICTDIGIIFVRMQTWVAEIGFHQTESFLDFC